MRLASLEDESPQDVAAPWAEEARERSRQVKASEVTLRPADEVIEEAKSRLKG